MLDGVILLWFVLAALRSGFGCDRHPQHTEKSPVLKWGFVLVTAFTGALGAFLYVLGCREPLPGCTNGTSPRDGAKCSARRCIASPATASASSPGLYSSVLGLAEGDDVDPRILPGLRVRMEDLSGAVHARHFRRLLISPR